MKNKLYEIFPGSRNGEMIWWIKYEDGTEETVPFENNDTKKKIESCVQKHRLKKRKEKIDKILNGK